MNKNDLICIWHQSVISADRSDLRLTLVISLHTVNVSGDRSNLHLALLCWHVCWQIWSGFDM